MCKISHNLIFQKVVGLEKNERHHVKGRITKMEVIPNLCVSQEVVHENHGGKT
jgi:hypothetical protein